MARRCIGCAILALAVRVLAAAVVVSPLCVRVVTVVLVLTIAVTGGIGRIAGFIGVAAGRRLAARAGVLGCVAVVALGVGQAVVCLLDTFIFHLAQKRARTDLSTINKGLKLLISGRWQVIRTPVRAPISSLVLNIVLNLNPVLL